MKVLNHEIFTKIPYSLSLKCNFCSSSSCLIKNDASPILFIPSLFHYRTTPAHTLTEIEPVIFRIGSG